MAEFFFRTEDIKPDEIKNYFVEIKQDRVIVDSLKARNPIILIGSRGVGKSFLLRVAESELLTNFRQNRVFPVYLTFNKSSLIHTDSPEQFQYWMLARLCSVIIRTLRKEGILSIVPSSLPILAGGTTKYIDTSETPIDKIAQHFEDSWKNPGVKVDVTGLPTVDTFKEALEDICSELNIARFVILIDEAAHIFLPKQQRQFFTLFRDLRSPYITCNAAVYPGVTSFGDTFQPSHDATLLTVDRNLLDDKYIINMREIVEKQADSATMAKIEQYGENFSTLAYAASGNPRLLLKTLSKAPKLNGKEVNDVIREFYRTDVWSEHSNLIDKYPGHRSLIDWGRRFVEGEILPELHKKNTQYLATDKKTTFFFWIHRDVPEPVKEALRLLAYTGIVIEHSTGIKASRSEIGTRYSVHLGCLFALESSPNKTSVQTAKNLTVRRMTEYGANHSAYQSLISDVPNFIELDTSDVLKRQLVKPLNTLDLTEWQKNTLDKIGLKTIGDLLQAQESTLQQAHYVGVKKSRRMRNAAFAAVFEYLSG